MAKEIRFEGMYELDKKIRDSLDLDAVKRVVHKNGDQLNNKAKRNAEHFRGHYEWQAGKGRVFVEPTGTLRSSINTELSNGGMTATVEPGVDYAAYVELGTRRMEAQPYLKPAWEEQKEQFKSDMDELVK